MPPKRRSDRDLQQQQQSQQKVPGATASSGSSSNSGSNNHHKHNAATAAAAAAAAAEVTADQELFLQAYEKPTQIYRYLRTRNQVSPIFLYRNLSYMKDWPMKRGNKARRNFRVNSILDRHLAKIDKNVAGNGRMTIAFTGVFHPSLSESQEPVNVETYLVKICHKKRKDVSTPIMQVSVGSAKIPVNPANSSASSSPTSCIHVPKESFNLGGTSKTYMLYMTVQFSSSSSPTLNGDSDDEPPAAKRCKLSGTPIKSETETRIYSSELTVYDKHNKCQLTEGEYALGLTELQGSVRSSPRKHLSWETLASDVKRDCPPLDDFDQQLLLKFKLSWTRETQNGFVDRPNGASNNGALPVAAAAAAVAAAVSAGDNKENRPRNNGLVHNNNTSTNNANNSSLNSSSLLGTPKAVTFANGESAAGTSKRLQIVYQFLYNNNTRQLTAACEELKCPWCSLECGRLYSLLKHLKLCHSRFNFTYAPIPQGARIDVAINHFYDGSYSGSPHSLILQPSTSKNAKTGPARRTSVSNILVCRPKRQKPSLSEFLEPDENEVESSRPYITGHNRLYHHTVTCLPIYPKELDVDSEGENDPKWLQTKTMMMIDDFTDVNEGEKELMKMWNLHVMKHGYVGDCQIPLACQMFVEQRGKELLMKNLYRNFILHMSNLFDFSLISPPVLFQTIQKLQDIMRAEGANSEARKVLQKAHADQVEWWSVNGSQNFSEPVKTANSVQASKVHFNNQDTHRRKTTTLPMSSPTGNAHLHAKHPSMMSSGTSALGNLHSPKDTAAPTATVNGDASSQIRRKSAIDHQDAGNNANKAPTAMQRRKSLQQQQQQQQQSSTGNENEYHRRKLILDPVPNGTTTTKTVQNGSF